MLEKGIFFLLFNKTGNEVTINTTNSSDVESRFSDLGGIYEDGYDDYMI